MSDNELDLRYWTGRRVSRRRALAGAAAAGAGLAALGLVGCSGGDDDNGNGNGGKTPEGDGNTVNDGTQDGPGKPGGILRVRQNPALPSMNPFGPGIFALAQGLFLGFTVFDHMWYVPTDTGVRELFLATQVEQPDDRTVIATLGDAVFHNKQPANGRKVLASDVAASFKRFRQEAPTGFSWYHHVMDDIVASDERTVKITQKTAWAWVFTSSNAGSPIWSSILPEEILTMDDLLQKDAVGSGHWVLDGHDNGANIKLRKFDKFRVAGQPLLDGIDFRYITDDNAGIAAFRAGEIDTTGFTSKQQADDTKSALGDKIVTGSDLSRDYLNLMFSFQGPYTDIRVRRAMNKLIDRDEAILLLADGNAQKAGPIPPAHKRYALPEDDKDLAEYFRTDIDGAKKLLEAASWDFDHEIELKHSVRPSDSELAQVLQQQFARGGVKVKLVAEDLVKWFSQTLNQGEFEATCFLHLPYEDPDLPLRFYLSPEGDRTNFMKYKNEKVDAAVLAAARELDEEARVEKVYEAQRVIMAEAAPMFNIMSKIGYGGRYSYVKGSITGRGSMGLFNRTTWLDKA